MSCFQIHNNDNETLLKLLHGVIYGYVTTTAEPRNLVPDDTRQWLTETHFKSSGIGRQLHAMKICGQCRSIRIIIPRFNENRFCRLTLLQVICVI